jgi:DNA invertase Pin-like site-specific DNA recombinase
MLSFGARVVAFEPQPALAREVRARGSRHSLMMATVQHLQRLDVCGVSWRSHTEPHLSTDDELVRDILFALLSSLAKLEARKIRERTVAGLQRARAQGKTLGRPKVADDVEAAVRTSLSQGNGIIKTAKLCGCGVGTVQRIKAQAA